MFHVKHPFYIFLFCQTAVRSDSFAVPVYPVPFVDTAAVSSPVFTDSTVSVTLYTQPDGVLPLLHSAPALSLTVSPAATAGGAPPALFPASGTEGVGAESDDVPALAVFASIPNALSIVTTACACCSVTYSPSIITLYIVPVPFMVSSSSFFAGESPKYSAITAASVAAICASFRRSASIAHSRGLL